MVKIKFTPQHSKKSMPSDPGQSAQIDDYVQMLKNMSDEERQAFFQHIEQQLIEEDDFDFLDDDFLWYRMTRLLKAGQTYLSL